MGTAASTQLSVEPPVSCQCVSDQGKGNTEFMAFVLHEVFHIYINV